MGFDRMYIPELDVLMDIRNEYKSDKDFYTNFVGKCDVMIGSIDSMDYLDSIKKKIKKDGEYKGNGKHSK